MKNFPGSLTLVTLAGILATGACLAQSEEHPRYRFDEKTLDVSLADLNPANPADAQTLLYRLNSTVRKACSRSNESNRLEAMRDRQHCVDQSYANALAGINAKLGLDVEAVAATYDRTRGIAAASE
jgi:UrcA family protein